MQWERMNDNRYLVPGTEGRRGRQAVKGQKKRLKGPGMMQNEAGELLRLYDHGRVPVSGEVG